MFAHRLANGQQVWIRPIQPADAWRLQEGLQRLSAETIQRRFLGIKTSFTSSELRYLTEVDGVDHIALVAISTTTRRLVAVARAVRLPEDPETAEWAIVVADPLQGTGLGTVLVRALVEEARRHGIRRFTATVAGENRAVLRLLHHVNDQFDTGRVSRGVREVTVDLPLAA
jgi:RimJ/RimL family protein N-acetyltransferase